MSTYQSCPREVYDLAKQLREQFHPELDRHNVTVRYVFAHAPENEDGEKRGAAIRRHGVPCLGLARIVGPKDRACGVEDAEIALDGDQWESLSDGQQRALLDHELQHLEVQMVKGSATECKQDDVGRPKLAMRKHDVEIGWFKVIAERHGSASFEVKQARDLWTEHEQTFFPFVGQLDLDQ